MSGASLNRLVFTSITLQVDGPHDPHRGVDDGGQIRWICSGGDSNLRM